MLARGLICVAFVLPFICSSALPEESKNPPYFIHPRDRQPGDITPRIIGGEEVKPHTYPFQAALLIHKNTSTYFCGGTLLTNQWVLTAAHCVDIEPDYILVRLGEHNLTDIEPTAVLQNTTEYVIHTGWDPDAFENDVAVIRLPQNVTFTDYIQPIKFAKGTSKYVGKNATLIGWGHTESGRLSDVLKRVNSTVMTNYECADMNPNYKEVLKPTHICSSGDGTIGACSGDSGGPLIVNGVQVGITSFVTNNCQLGMPTVFTRITEFHDWILEHAGGETEGDDEDDDGDDDDDDDGGGGGDNDGGNGGASAPNTLQFTAVVLIALCFSYIFK